MRFRWAPSIARKLTLLMVLVSGVSLLVAVIPIVANHSAALRDAKKTQLTALAAVLASNSTAAMSFRLPGPANELLSSLRYRPTVEYACLFDDRGEVFASYRSDADSTFVPELPDWTGSRFTPDDYLEISLPVAEDGEVFGRIYLRAATSDLRKQYYRDAGIVLVVVLAALVVAALIAASLQRIISRPIVALATTAQRITEEGNYTLRVQPRSKDEIGNLYEQFNLMLDRIQTGENEQRRAAQQQQELIAELEVKNSELERFAYTVSHDLKSPLVTIKGHLGLLKRDLAANNAELIQGDLAQIDSAAKKMNQLLCQLLELSRIGRVTHPPEDVGLADLACDAVELLGGELSTKRIAVEIGPNLPTLHGDRVRLLEVLQNLIENAIKYMGDQTEPRIEIGARREGDEVVCYVRDNGMGIAPTDRETIFKLFSQLDQSVEGTGVGLALVKRIIEVHGGRIWVESEGPGRGSTFCFTIPPAKRSAS